MCACKTETVKEWAFWMSVPCWDYYCNSVSMFRCMILKGNRTCLMLFIVLLKETVGVSVLNECVVLRLFLPRLFLVLWKWTAPRVNVGVTGCVVTELKHYRKSIWHYFLYCGSRKNQALMLTWLFVWRQNGDDEGNFFDLTFCIVEVESTKH